MPITDPDWVPPIEISFDVEKPIRSEQGLMLAGNPIAMAAGKPGAPRIQFAALPSLEVGDTVKISQIGTALTAATSEITRFSCGFVQAGTIRLVAEYAREAGAGTVTITMRIKRTRNGTATTLSTTSTTSSTLQLVSIDIPIIPGDVVSVTIQSTSDTVGQRGRLENTSIRTTGDDIWPASNSDMQSNLFSGYW